MVEILFGTSTDDPKPDAGYLIFHDAWWIPKGEEGGSEDKPYVPEVVTVHAVEYYKNQGKKDAPHPDMESPNPNQQLAVQGSFYFVVEGVPQWAELGRKFLTLALEADGIGGKVALGMGILWRRKGKERQERCGKRRSRKKLLLKRKKKRNGGQLRKKQNKSNYSASRQAS